MARKIAIPIVIALAIVGFGGLALAYFPSWWGHSHPPYYWFEERPMPHSHWGIRPYVGRWGAPMSPFFASRLEAAGEALSKATGIPVDKLKSVWQKYPMPPRMFLRAVALSKLLNKDLEEVVKEFSANPPLYLWKSGVDPSQLMRKEWELMGKVGSTLGGRFPLRGWGRRMMW